MISKQRLLCFMVQAMTLAQATANGDLEQTNIPSSVPVRVRFVLSARKLPDTEVVSITDFPDGFVKVIYYRSPGFAPSEVQQTEVIDNNKNPDWEAVFEVDFYNGRQQKLKFTIVDHDTGTRDDEIGTVEVNLKDIVNAPKNEFVKGIIGSRANNGELIIYSMIDNKVNDNTVTRLSNSLKRSQHFYTLIAIAD